MWEQIDKEWGTLEGLGQGEVWKRQVGGIVPLERAERPEEHVEGGRVSSATTGAGRRPGDQRGRRRVVMGSWFGKRACGAFDGLRLTPGACGWIGSTVILVVGFSLVPFAAHAQKRNVYRVGLLGPAAEPVYTRMTPKPRKPSGRRLRRRQDVNASNPNRRHQRLPGLAGRAGSRQRGHHRRALDAGERASRQQATPAIPIVMVNVADSGPSRTTSPASPALVDNATGDVQRRRRPWPRNA